MISFQPTSEYEKFKEIVREYETVYGTNSYSGNKKRDEEYSILKKKLEELKSEN
jgi:hypothetical protein